MKHRIGSGIVGLVAALLTACASTGATLGSGVGDRLLDEPPYYTGSRIVPAATDVAHLPIVFQRGAVQSPIFEPEAISGTPLARLLEEMNAYLDDVRGMPALDPPDFARAIPPDVRFSCEADVFGDCDSDSSDISRQGKPWMLLAVGRPSTQWTESLSRALSETDRRHVLVITLEVGEYWTHQKNLRGSKEVRLGTGYSQGVPWLTSLDQPVQVLQLTGAVVGPDGRAIRIGAEGLLAKRTNLILSGFGAQELISDDDVHRLRHLRRDDLQGEPLVWQAALRNLVRQLTD